jgi:hypothetical protein
MESLKRLLLATVNQPLPSTEPERQSKLRSILSRVGRSIKSNSVDTLHRKSKRHSSSNRHAITSTPQKRRRIVVTPSPSSIRTVSSLSSTTGQQSGGTNAAISEVLYGNVVPCRSNSTYHESEHHLLLSTTNLGLRRLSVSEVIDLEVGSIIVVVFPESSPISRRYEVIIQQQLRNKIRHLNGRDRIEKCRRTMKDRHSFS